MGLRSSVAKLVESAIISVGDIAETITYNARTTGVYNVTTGNVAHSTTSYTLNAIISPMSAGIGGSANDIHVGITGDLKALFASNDLAVIPDTNDTVTRGSETYAVNAVSSDPASASYTLILTKVG